MVRLLLAGIPNPFRKGERMPEVLTRDRRYEVARSGRRLIGMVAGLTSEWWPTSNRNRGRLRVGIRKPETLPPERRIPFRPHILLANAIRILANRRVALLIVATGFVFGAQLLYLSIAADLFADAYGVRDTFPVYFAMLAAGIGLASYLNGRLVGRFGMDAMARSGFLGLTLAGLFMVAASIAHDGRPPLGLLLLSGFAAFFAIGILFGNLNAMAMRSLGQLAGLGASLIASGSSLVATLFAIGLGTLYDGTVMVLAGGILLAGAASLLLGELSTRGSDRPILAVR